MFKSKYMTSGLGYTFYVITQPSNMKIQCLDDIAVLIYICNLPTLRQQLCTY